MSKISMRNRQYGMTLIGYLAVLAVVLFFALMAMRLVPVYLEYYSVVQSMKTVAGSAGQSGRSELRTSLERHFQINDVKSVEANKTELIEDGDGRRLQVDYEVRKPFFYNVDFVVKFDHAEVLAKKPGDE